MNFVHIFIVNRKSIASHSMISSTRFTLIQALGVLAVYGLLSKYALMRGRLATRWSSAWENGKEALLAAKKVARRPRMWTMKRSWNRKKEIKGKSKITIIIIIIISKFNFHLSRAHTSLDQVEEFEVSIAQSVAHKVFLAI
jgi:hypothetical protein